MCRGGVKKCLMDTLDDEKGSKNDPPDDENGSKNDPKVDENSLFSRNRLVTGKRVEK